MLIKKDKDIIQSYFEDHSGLLGGFADKVYIPDNEKEIIEYIKTASSQKKPVTISGAGTGVTGGRIPFGGDVLSMEALNKIINIKKLSDSCAVATVQPGVTVQQLKDKAKENGWMYPPDPTEQTSFIGGNVSTNASGSRGYKYGPTRKYVNRLRVILSCGDVLDISRGNIFSHGQGEIKIPLLKNVLSVSLPKYKLPNIKNAAGYFNQPGMDLIDLFIGHEGTLGIMTEIDVLLQPVTDKIFSGVAFFTDEKESWNFVLEGKVTIPNTLSYEYFDSYALGLLKKDYPQIPDASKAAIFFEQDLTGQDEDKILNKWIELLEKHGVNQEKVWFATSNKDQESFREFRHALPEKVNEIVKKNKLPKVGTDIAVPNEHLPEMMEFFTDKLEDSDIPYLIFGHIGESHLHANILPENNADYEKSRRIYVGLVEKAINLGGTVSAEHGIGKLKHIFLEKMIGKQGLIEIAQLKKTIDPSCILGLGNIFPKELLHSL
ncbi:MAG: FAD-binding oxidoreductase [Endomicrobiales bacterium]|nr:FAD-binding oxidoreductase [Endomicrobiales bacterium]